MNNPINPKISMAIDVKRYRLRIHQGTLKALGNPPFLQLLFSPKRKAIVVLSREKQVPNGQEIRVVFDRKNRPGSCDIYSKELMDRIRNQFSGIDQRGLYRLTGFEVPEEHGVFFPLSTLSRQEDAHVQGAAGGR